MFGEVMGSIHSATQILSFSHARVIFAELKINHPFSLITTHDNFDSADPSSMQAACHI